MKNQIQLILLIMQEIQEPGNLTQILEILCTGTCPKASIAEKGAYALRKLRPGRKVCGYLTKHLLGNMERIYIFLTSKQ